MIQVNEDDFRKLLNELDHIRKQRDQLQRDNNTSLDLARKMSLKYRTLLWSVEEEAVKQMKRSQHSDSYDVLMIMEDIEKRADQRFEEESAKP